MPGRGGFGRPVHPLFHHSSPAYFASGFRIFRRHRMQTSQIDTATPDELAPVLLLALGRLGQLGPPGAFTLERRLADGEPDLDEAAHCIADIPSGGLRDWPGPAIHPFLFNSPKPGPFAGIVPFQYRKTDVLGKRL